MRADLRSQARGKAFRMRPEPCGSASAACPPCVSRPPTRKGRRAFLGKHPLKSLYSHCRPYSRRYYNAPFHTRYGRVAPGAHDSLARVESSAARCREAGGGNQTAKGHLMCFRPPLFDETDGRAPTAAGSIRPRRPSARSAVRISVPRTAAPVPLPRLAPRRPEPRTESAPGASCRPRPTSGKRRRLRGGRRMTKVFRAPIGPWA